MNSDLSQLPAAAASLNIGPHPSPLHAHLNELVGTLGYGGVDSNKIASTARGILAIAALHPFDPQAPVGTPEAATRGHGFSLLEAVLQLPGHGFTPPVRVSWPTPADNGPLVPHKHQDNDPDRELDMEWVAASLVQAGCNPWKAPNTADGSVPRPVTQAIELGMAGLMERFLACPGAPDAATLGDARLPPRRNSGQPPQTLWQGLLATSHGARVLPVFIEAGLRLPEGAKAAVLLRDACLAAIDALVECKVEPKLTEAQGRSVRNAWKERVKRGHLTAEQVGQMAEQLWQGSAASELAPDSVEIARLCAVTWGKTASDDSYMVHKFLAAAGPDRLCHRAPIPAGPAAGQWSLLSAGVFSRIRQNTGAGVQPWSLQVMAGDNAPAGALAPALGFDWRPGIAIEGVVLLGLSGNCQLEDYGRAWEEEVARFTNLAAIPDMPSWVEQHLPASARFTIELLSRPSIGALNALNHTWSKCIQAADGAMGHLEPELAEQLFVALANTTWAQDQKGWSGGKVTGLFRALFPAIETSYRPLECTPPAKELSAPHLRAYLHFSLVNNLLYKAPKLEDQVFALLEQRPDGLSAVDSFWKSVPDHEHAARWLARCDELRMEQETASPVAARKPRGVRL